MIRLLLTLVILALLWSHPSTANSGKAEYHHCLKAPQLQAKHADHTITVQTVEQLQSAVYNAKANSTIVITPGTYQLTSTLGITQNNITIIGASNDCGAVELIGAGMDNSDHQGIEHGVWVDAENATIANITLSEFFLHPITMSGNAHGAKVYNVRMINAGQQFIKVNPIEYGIGANSGSVEYSIMQYTQSPPALARYGAGSGYTNGVDIHAGKGWKISHNLFKNFHTPDSADHLWNAAVLVWNGAEDTITENNVFIDTDRAIAYGLTEKSPDHRGGVIRNNMVTMTRGLYTDSRAAKADAAIIVWDSPGTQVVHNTVLTNNNTPFAIEVRFDESGVNLSHNISDAPVGKTKIAAMRSLCRVFNACGKNITLLNTDTNVMQATPGWFIDPDMGNLRLKPETAETINNVTALPYALFDIDGEPRKQSTIPGADTIN